MKLPLLLILILLVLVGFNSTDKRQLRNFQFFTTKDTLSLKVKEFYKNSAYCFTEGIPYALIIGTTLDSNKTISVLAVCNNNSYIIGQFLRVVAIENPTLNTSLRPIYFIKDTIIKKQKYRALVGAEFPAVWGKVL